MLLQRAVEWRGVPWVWLAGADQPNHYVWFVRDLELKSEPDDAWFAIASSGPYQLYIGDQLVHQGPCREAPPFAMYDVLDLAPLLTVGHQRIRILAHHEGVDHRSACASPPGILMTGRIQSAGQAIDLTPPKDWQCLLATAYQPSWRLGACLGWAEHVAYHAAVTPAISGPVLGQLPSECGIHPCHPRPELLARDIPLLHTATKAAELHSHTPAGMLYDFGEEVFGRITITFSAEAAAGCDILYGEQLIDGQVRPVQLGMDYRDHIEVVPTDHEIFTTFGPRAGRYVFITNNVLEIQSVQVQETLYPFTRDVVGHETNALLIFLRARCSFVQKI